MPQQTNGDRFDREILIEAALLAIVAMIANAGSGLLHASVQADSQRYMDAVRQSAHTAMEELAVATKAANMVLGDTPSGNGGADAKQLKKIYRLLKASLRSSGAPVVT